MPRYNVELNGKWACFSSISDGFITQFMEKEPYESWRKLEYGYTEQTYAPAEECNLLTMKEAVYSIRCNRTHKEALEMIMECGLSIEECKKWLFIIEREYYCPKKDLDGNFRCPNCNTIIRKGQKRCKDKTCNQEFLWRKKDLKKS